MGVATKEHKSSATVYNSVRDVYALLGGNVVYDKSSNTSTLILVYNEITVNVVYCMDGAKNGKLITGKVTYTQGNSTKELGVISLLYENLGLLKGGKTYMNLGDLLNCFEKLWCDEVYDDK